ncbi:DNA primase [hydrothermal vent metagenome]|uniref:DNA primase n=1 Tax=hydrothermal vent metagenome TaxID=652676 RepID=A0A3B1C9P7_9ZZZZ
MSGIAEHIIDDIRGRADIVEVVSDYLALKKAGANYRALCPFHDEKTPSFNVNPEKRIFHCFGCGEGGNVFTFLMKLESITFPEAVSMLGKRYGVAIPERGGVVDSDIEKVYSVLAIAEKFYHNTLKNEGVGSKIKLYLASRELDNELIEAFSLGFAPDEWDALLIHLRKNSFGDSIIEKAGLITKSSRGTYIDRFRNRLLFPIHDAGGRVIAFGGRTLETNAKSAKYINSPETPVYHKSRVLYGYHLAKQPARREEAMIVVEGYMDVVAMKKAGVENCVAVSGTAFTSEQAVLLSRVCEKAVLVFDSDKAGLSAAQRSGEILSERNLSVRVLVLPGAKDPDEFFKEHDLNEFLALVKSAPSFIQFAIDRTLAGFDLSDVEGRVKAVRLAVPLLRRVKDEIERDQYMKYLSERTGAREDVVRREVSGSRASATAPAPKEAERARTVSSKAEKVLIRMLLDHPQYLGGQAKELVPEDFTDSLYRKMFALILEGAGRNIRSAAGILDLAEDENLRRELSMLSMEKGLIDEDNRDAALVDHVRVVKHRPGERRKLRERMKLAGETASVEEFFSAGSKYLEAMKKKEK